MSVLHGLDADRCAQSPGEVYGILSFADTRRTNKAQYRGLCFGDIWQRYAHNIVAAKAVPSGHYLADEAPAETTAALREFFAAK